MKNKGLGRGLGMGLAALIGEGAGNIGAEDRSTSARMIDIKRIEPNKSQPRKTFDEDAIAELATSIAQHGIIQPIIIRKNPESDLYQIIAGERRWRAALLSGLDQVPVIIKSVDDKQLAEQALIENIQRQDLNPLEEANAYMELMGQYNYSQEQLSKTIGKSRSHVANMLRVTSLPSGVQKYISEGKLSFSHAKVIAGHDHAEQIAKEIIAKDLSVRKAEDLTRNFGSSSNSAAPKKSSVKGGAKDSAQNTENDPTNDDLQAIEASLTASTGLKVSIENKGSSGKVIISFNSYVQLDDIIELLSQNS